MKRTEVTHRTPDLLNRLLEVWEGSVRATHLFLSEGEIIRIREYVPQALKGIAHLLIAENEAGLPVAFMGIENGALEMLFIAPEERGMIQIILAQRIGVDRFAGTKKRRNTFQYQQICVH